MPEVVLVTGASGFLGSHVVLQLLEKGYHVRGVARGAKASALQSTYASFGPAFSVVSIGDLATDQFPEQLQGVDALIHLATPMPGKVAPAEQSQKAIDGTLNIVVQAEQAGVKKVVVTSSVATALNMLTGTGHTDQDWNPMTKEMAIGSGNPMAIYAVSKKDAELALWDWAEKHPHVEVTTLNPSFFYGPFTPYYPPPATPNPLETNFSTNYLLYGLLFQDGNFPALATTFTDIRDAAAAHVAALSSPPTSEVGRKRILFSSPYGWPASRILEFLAEKRPALKDRLLTTPPAPPPKPEVFPTDWARVEKVLGLKKEGFKTIEETLLDTVDSILKVEEGWKSKGLEPVKPVMF